MSHRWTDRKHDDTAACSQVSLHDSQATLGALFEKYHDTKQPPDRDDELAPTPPPLRLVTPHLKMGANKEHAYVWTQPFSTGPACRGEITHIEMLEQRTALATERLWTCVHMPQNRGRSGMWFECVALVPASVVRRRWFASSRPSLSVRPSFRLLSLCYSVCPSLL